MKKKDFDKIKDSFKQKKVIVNTLDGKQIIGECHMARKNANFIVVGDAKINMKNIATINLYNDNEIFKYVTVVYADDDFENEYYYKTTLKDIKNNDIVMVDRQGRKTEAVVVDVNLYTRASVPYPVEKTKDIILVVNKACEDFAENKENSNGITSDNYIYKFNEIEQKVKKRLMSLGFNFKQYLRIILLLRTHNDSNRQCAKMLSYLENYDIQKLGTIEIEKYARLLADDENFAKHCLWCPIINGNISIIDCLELSNEEAWQDEDPNFINKCQNCKWHNPQIDEDAYQNDEPIMMLNLTEKLLREIKYEDVIAFTIAENSAMGKSGNIEIITNIDNELLGYETNPLSGGLPFTKIYLIIPWLEELQIGLMSVNNVEEGWHHINMGMGNHLFIRDYYYPDMMKLAKDKHTVIIYKSWKNWCKEICVKKPYVRETKPFYMKPRKKYESLYDFLERNMKNGFLPDDFSLREFKHYPENGLRFVDGMLDYCCSEDEDLEILELLKNIVKIVDNETVISACHLIDEYYARNVNKRIIGTIDNFLRWIMENTKEYNANLIFELGLCLVLNAQEIETVKIGIGLLGLLDLKDKVVNLLKMFALSDEFTMYVNIALGYLENINEIRFELVQKLKGYGKLNTVPRIEANTKEIREWLFSHGCENNIDNGWLAIDIINLIDVPAMIKSKNLTDEELNGIYNIMEGLMQDEPKKGISIYPDREELFVALIQKNTTLKNNLTYLKILCMIKIYLENTNNFKYIALIDDILNTEANKEMLLSNIKVGNNLNDIINISRCLNNFDIYDQILNIFKENLKQSYEDIAINLLPYLMEKSEYLGDILDILRANITYKDILGDPEAIVEMQESYNLTMIIRELAKYPLRGIDFVMQGLYCKYMYPRRAALDTIESWLKIQNKKAKDYLPLELYDALLSLQEKEIVKDYKESLNKILNIKEDLTNYEEPTIKYFEEKLSSEINLFTGDIDSLFTNTTILRGMDYYENDNVYNIIKNGDAYIGYVAGSNNEDYKVIINIDENNNIKSMSCTCPYKGNCKHEYAAIIDIRNKD